MKPLVLFSSLAVLCAGGLAVLSYKGWQDDPSALTSLTSGSQTVKIKPAEMASTPPAGQQSAETSAAPAEKAEEKVAAVAPEAADTAPSAETVPDVKLGDETAKPEAGEAEPEGASFDIVRVEEDGSAVLAGRAAPGSTVRLLINEKVAGETQANERGEWVVIPAEPMPAGAHQMQIETENAAGEVKLAEQSVALTVPDQPGTQPLIVLSETAKPSKVLQKPEAAEVKQAEAAQESTASENGEASTAAGQQPAADSKTAALQPPATATAPAATSTARSLNVDVVDYNDAGLTTFSGRSTPASTVRVYVDDVYTGEAIAGSDGTWSFTAVSEIASGPHTLRTDQLAQDGSVSERIELPFFRESAERIASLQEQRKTAQEEQAKPETAATAAAEPATAGAAEPDTNAEVAATAAEAEPAKTEAPTATEARVADNVKPVEEAPSAEKPEPAASQPTSGVKGDAETVKADIAPAAAESDPTRQTAAVESSAEPAKPETTQQQVAAADPVAEPVKPADLIPATEDDAPPEEVAKPEPDAASVETAAVMSQTEQAETVTPVTGETATPVTGKVVIQPGNNLWQISRVIYGQGRQYTVIYDANKEQIRDPDRIYPGQIFETPGSDAPESIDPACKLPLAECN